MNSPFQGLDKEDSEGMASCYLYVLEGNKP